MINQPFGPASKTLVLPLVLPLIPGDQLFYPKIDRAECFEGVIALNARFRRSVHRAKTFFGPQHSPHHRRGSRLSNEVGRQCGGETLDTEERRVETGIFIIRHLVRQDASDTACSHRTNQLGDTARRGRHQLPASALAAAMHQLIEFFQGYWLVERHQITQSRQVHAQELPIT